MKSAEVAKFWEANAESWTRFVRAGYDVYRDAQNTPAFLAMLPDVRGLSGIDIGCGEGANTRKLARLGANMRAIDVAPTFIRHAKATEGAAPLGILYQVANGERELRFRNCLHVANGHAGSWARLERGRARASSWRLLSILDRSSVFCASVSSRGARCARAGAVDRGRQILRARQWARERMDVHKSSGEGTQADRAVSHSHVPPDAEQLG
jgi:SAM-dependent methyltransferase